MARIRVPMRMSARRGSECQRGEGNVNHFGRTTTRKWHIGAHTAHSEMVREKNIHDACCFDSSPRSTYRALREKIQSTLRGPWWQGYENKQVNALIKQAEKTVNNTDRQKIYRQIYTLVRDDAPWIYLYRPIRYWGVGLNLKEWKPRMDGLLIFN